MKTLIPMKTRILIPVALVLAGAAGAQDPGAIAQLPLDGSGWALFRRGNLVAVPAALATPAIGFGVGAALAVEAKHDSSTGSAVFGVGGAYTTNSSWIAGIGGRAAIARDMWHPMAGFGAYEFNYDFFGVGTAAGDADRSVRVRQHGTAAIANLTYQVLHKLYVGPSYQYVRMITSPHDDDPLNALSPLVRTEHDFIGSMLGGVADYDLRDDESEPTRGTFAHGTALFSRDGLGATRRFDSYGVWANQYVPLPHKQVLAFRIAGCGVSGDPPVWELCQFGSGPDLRGYQAGQYRDRTLLAGQGEWRVPIWKRIGGVAFAGVGEVAPSLGDMTGSDLLPSGGLGVRYMALPASHVNLGVDYAWGKPGGAFYFRIGEAF